MNITLYPEDGRYLEPREVASRLAQSMPKILIDWARGNQLVEETRLDLVKRNAPDVILESHDSHFDRTAQVTIWFPQFVDQSVHFVIWQLEAIDMQVGNAGSDECLLFAARRMSDVLGYEMSVTPCTSSNSSSGASKSGAIQNSAFL